MGKEIRQKNTKKSLQTEIDSASASRLAELFSALADSTRIRIISSIVDKEVCVHELCEKLNMTQSAISHQLRVLRDRRIVRHRKQGRHIFYQLDDEHIRELFQRAADHVKHTD